MQGKFIKNTKYYTGTVYEWNLPAGSTCPFAKEGKVEVDKETGKFSKHTGEFKCYAASAERFPAVRAHRHHNLEFIKAGGMPELPKGCTAVRIHASGDFFSQSYFDMRVWIARNHPEVEFWAFTKSVNYWLVSIDYIPSNFTLTASYGGHHDFYIDKFGLKHCRVYKSPSDVPKGMPVDTNDDLARKPGVNFALLDNHLNKKTNG